MIREALTPVKYMYYLVSLDRECRACFDIAGYTLPGVVGNLEQVSSRRATDLAFVESYPNCEGLTWHLEHASLSCPHSAVAQSLF